MNRSFYSYAILFTGLNTLIILFRSILSFWLGPRTNELQLFTSWVIFEFLLSLTWMLILLKYFHYKKYTFTFWAMSVHIAASLFQFILLYQLLKIWDISSYYILASFIFLATGMLYAISLIFSQAGKRIYLKAAGIFLFFFYSASATLFFWFITSVGARINGMIAKSELWTSILESLAVFLFILHFRAEREQAAETDTSTEAPLNGWLAFAAFAALIATLIYIPRITFESISLSDNPDEVGEHLQIMAQPFEARTYVNSKGDVMRYRLLKPSGYDATKKYPLVVCLHGGSGAGTDNIKQVAASLPAQWLSEPENRVKYPAFLLVPQCPPKAAWGGIPNVPAIDSLLIESMLALEKEFTIDAERRYVTGNSLGGYGTWHLISTRPEMFAAAIPICGGGNPSLARQMVNIPVWAFHGAKDNIVPVSGSRDIVQAIKHAGGNPRYTEYPNEGHHILGNVTATPGLLEWLFSQQRN